MKRILIVGAVLFAACGENKESKSVAAEKLPIEGTWKLMKGTLVEKSDTTVTDYNNGKLSFIKVLNGTHFSFLLHDLKQGKDSATATFSAGGGRYTLEGSTYTEHLEYCNDRAWEGHDFPFQITIHGDTLTQTGVEKVAETGVERHNTEVYLRWTK
jgi:predicted small secreted protein